MNYLDAMVKMAFLLFRTFGSVKNQEGTKKRKLEEVALFVLQQ